MPEARLGFAKNQMNGFSETSADGIRIFLNNRIDQQTVNEVTIYLENNLFLKILEVKGIEMIMEVPTM